MHVISLANYWLRAPNEAPMQGPQVKPFRTALAASLLLAAMLGTAAGGPFEDAVRAYKKGDYETALELFRPFAEDGRADAEYTLGFMYFTGRGVPPDYAEAAKWLRLAAEQGRADAQYALGKLYLNGQGVTPDNVLAYMWFDLAAAQGAQAAVVQAAATARDGVARQMTPAQVAQAQQLARDWKPTSHREEVDMHQFPWSSIGKVGDAGQQCTGAVIGPKEFLTAAHCLYLFRTGRFLAAQSINILLGYEKGDYRVRRVASRYSIAPEFDPSPYGYPPDLEKLMRGARHDWAIVYVEEPFPADVKPLRLTSAIPSPGTAAMLVGYPIERLHMMTADRHCRVVEISSDTELIGHDCVTHRGDSGGPLLSRDDEGLILGVNDIGPDLRVHIKDQSVKWGAAASAASIAKFLASPAR
jgi:V8-like Glu-specific endopeptidase